YGEHREALEFNRDQHKELQELAKNLDITFFSTAFDIASADFLEELDMPMYKIASGDLKHIPLLRHVACFGKPIILSTGGGTLEDIRRAVDTIVPINPQLAILQCTAAYPCDFSELNLRVINTLREEFPELVIGLSDHDNGIAMSVAAYILGARIIEKHFTLNRANRGTDHAFSLEPTGLRKMVRDLHRTRQALGDGIKGPVESEKRPLVKMSKALYSACPLPAGTVLSAEHIAFRCPGTIGLSPDFYDRVLGAKLKRDLKEEELILWEDLELRP
ncbi:MAG: N-acetylneuraminate synthase family protein, partial [Verrucomicrobiia bacterium]